MEISAEVYYKKLSHQHEYSGSILDFFTQVYHIENNMIHGKGYNYGLNLMLKKEQRQTLRLGQLCHRKQPTPFPRT